MKGALLSLHRYPVKSMRGEPVVELEFDGRGAAGDRSYSLLDLHKGSWRRLTARQAPQMLAWQASYPEAAPDIADPPPPLLRAPDGSEYGWGDPALPAQLESHLGRPVRLHRDPAGQQDLGRSLLVTLESTRAGLELELGGELELLRFRPNLHVELAGAPAFAETRWEDLRLRVGEAELDLLHPCVRCVIPTRDPAGSTGRWPELLRHLARSHETLFGINARAGVAAGVRVGDPVELLS